jgi:hypothetical protein
MIDDKSITTKQSTTNRKRTVRTSAYDATPKRSIADDLIYQVKNNIPFSDKVCDYFGINTELHESVIRSVITERKIDDTFWQSNCENGVAISDAINKVLGTQHVFATTHDYIPSEEKDGKLINRRERPMDPHLLSRMETQFAKYSPKSRRVYEQAKEDESKDDLKKRCFGLKLKSDS